MGGTNGRSDFGEQPKFDMHRQTAPRQPPRKGEGAGLCHSGSLASPIATALRSGDAPFRPARCCAVRRPWAEEAE